MAYGRTSGINHISIRLEHVRVHIASSFSRASWDDVSAFEITQPHTPYLSREHIDSYSGSKRACVSRRWYCHDDGSGWSAGSLSRARSPWIHKIVQAGARRHERRPTFSWWKPGGLAIPYHAHTRRQARQLRHPSRCIKHELISQLFVCNNLDFRFLVSLFSQVIIRPFLGDSQVTLRRFSFHFSVTFSPPPGIIENR